MSKLLTSLYKRAMWENRSCCSLKKSMWVIRSWFEQIGIKNHSKNLYFSCVYDSFSTFYVEGESLPLLFNHLLFFKERLERFAPVALYEQVIVSNLLRLFMTKEWQEQFALFHAQIVLSLTKKSESLKKPMIKFPTLLNLDLNLVLHWNYCMHTCFHSNQLYYVCAACCTLFQNLIVIVYFDRKLKGSVSQDFRPPVFFMIQTHLGPW